MDRSDCDQRFGAANIARIDSFRITGGEVDFGDLAHIGGEPRGNAVICWLNNGRVAVLGKLFSDNFRDPQTATIEITFRRRNGRLTNPTTRSLTTQGGFVSWRDIEKLSPIGDFEEVRIRLKDFSPDSGHATVVASRTFKHKSGETVRLHLKIGETPNININTMVDRMKQVFASVNIGVEVMSRENLNLPNDLRDLPVGLCIQGFTTAEQNRLFQHRNSANVNEIVIYFVRTTDPPFAGCATHPPELPGAVVASGASEWTLAHEVGHVLGLSHVNDNNRLMTENGTGNITNLPPDLTASEATTMYASELT